MSRRYTLAIAAKGYSSWSLRGWLACRIALGGNFDEVMLELSIEARQRFLVHSPSGKVPALRDNELGVVINESLAIALFLADQYPASNLMPMEAAAKALCLSASAEMASGFHALRTHMSMNVRSVATIAGKAALEREDVRIDVGRLDTIFSSLLTKYEGPYLFGRNFSVAGDILQHKLYSFYITTLKPFHYFYYFVQM